MPANPLHNSEAELARLASKWTPQKKALPLWRVRDWADVFETSETRKYRQLRRVSVPNKHEGKGWKRLCGLPLAPALLGTFVVIVELASKAPARGYLADEDGPWTTEDMADMSGLTPYVSDFDRALSELSTDRIDWLEKIELSRALQEIPGEVGRRQEKLGESPGKTNPPGESPGKTNPPGEVGRRRENSGVGLDRIGLEVPPFGPQGDQCENGAADASAAEKKEGPVDLAADAARRCFLIFGADFSRLSSIQQARLAEHAECGALPLDEKKWASLAAMRAERAAIPGVPDDLNLRHQWLVSKDSLIEHLPKAADIALARHPQGGASARTEKKEPAGWPQWLATAYPGTAAIPYGQAPVGIREEFERSAK